MLTIFRVVFGFLCFLKAVDIGTRGPEVIGLPLSLLIAIPWAAAAVAFMLGRVRVSAAVIIVGCVAVTVLSDRALYNQHLYLIASVCLIFLIGAAVPTLLRAQLSIVYAFAAVAKLNEAFLSGTVIYVSAVNRPFWNTFIGIQPESWFLIPLSILSIATEAGLAIAFWFPRARWVALVVGTGFHLVMLVLMTADPGSFLRLSIFGFLMIALYIPFFPKELDRLYARVTKRRIPSHFETSVAKVGW